MVKRQRTAMTELYESHKKLLETASAVAGIFAGTEYAPMYNAEKDAGLKAQHAFERAFNINPPPREPVDPPSVSSVTSVAALPSHQPSQDFAPPTQS